MKKLIITGALMMCASGAFAMDGMIMDSAHVKMMVDKHMQMMDTNGDGKVSKEEHAAGAEKMFMKADANHDGMVSRQELTDMKKSEMKDMSDDQIKMMVDKHMSMMDTNGDGMISKEEHAAGAEKMFMQADANHDGMVTSEEMMDMKTKEMKDMGMMQDDSMMMKK